jgi:glycerophosphoryl diester phosphodiesterase
MKLVFNLLFICILSCFILSCKRDPPLYEVHNLNGNKISAFGHGGMGIKFKFPIDCYSSISSCMEFGADGTEMDVQMTRDSILLAYHSGNLNEHTLCNGVINDKQWPEIWGCHFTSPLSADLGLSSVGDILSSLENHYDGTYTFDCKLYSNNPDRAAFLDQYANAIIRLMDAHHMDPSKLFIESQDSTFLRILQHKRNDLRLFIYPSSFEEGLAIAETMGLFGITISTDKITKDQVAYAHEKGFRVTLWNAESQQDNLNAILKSPDFIQSDDIIYLLKVFGKFRK